MSALSEHERTLLEHVREELRKEESAVAIYLGHLTAVITRTGLPEDEVARIREVLQRIIQTNQFHIELLDGIVRSEEPK